MEENILSQLIPNLKGLYQENLIGPLLGKIYSKPAPSKVLNDITFARLIELEKENSVDHEALWVGSIIADLFIFEAKEAKNMKSHLPLAHEFAEKFITENKINIVSAEKIIEIIDTHHGGTQKFLESKLFKIADCHKFLEPMGLIDLISDYYKTEGSELNSALHLAHDKLEEKYELLKDLAYLDKGFDVERHHNICSNFIEKAFKKAQELG